MDIAANPAANVYMAVLTHWDPMKHILPSLVHIMACRLFGAMLLPEPMLPYCQLDHEEHISMTFYLKSKSSNLMKCIGAMLSRPQ